MARAPSRDGVRRKPIANLRADEQERRMRRRLEASWHKTTKPRDLTATVNDAVAYMDVGKGREQDAEALRKDNSCPYLGRSA